MCCTLLTGKIFIQRMKKQTIISHSRTIEFSLIVANKKTESEVWENEKNNMYEEIFRPPE